MALPTMQRTDIDGVALELQDGGSGEPVVFVHGSMGDECAAILRQPLLAERYRLIHYHRRGYGDSECPEKPVSMAQQSADCQAVMRHLGVPRAHLVGQSYGAVILLQAALDAPEMAHSLTLIEPPLPSVLFNSAAFNTMVAKVIPLYAAGQKVEALDAFAQSVISASYRTVGFFARSLQKVHSRLIPSDASRTGSGANSRTIFRILMAFGPFRNS